MGREEEGESEMIDVERKGETGGSRETDRKRERNRKSTREEVGKGRDIEERVRK